MPHNPISQVLKLRGEGRSEQITLSFLAEVRPVSIEYVNVIENFLNSELSVGFDEGALLACKSLSEEQLAFFANQLSAVDQALHARMVQVEPRETILGSTSEARPAWSADEDIRPVSAMFRHPYNGLVPVALDHVKRQLLFFSRVAIVVPQLKMYGDTLTERQLKFVAYLRSVLELKPLVEDRSVVLLPHSGFYSDEIEGGAGLVRRACEEDAAISQWIIAHQAMLNDFAPGVPPSNSYFDAGIRICSALAYGHTLAATHPFVGHLHKVLLSDRGRTDRELIEATRNIDKIDLPNLSGLNWQDVVAVRRDEESLQKWRADLALAISSVDPTLPPDEFVSRFDSQVQKYLQRAALELGAKLNESSSTRRFNRGATDLIISAVAATARVALGGPMAIWDVVREVAQREGAKEALRFIWESRQSAARRALRSHYAVFCTPRE
jgi:hypothetical protein